MQSISIITWSAFSVSTPNRHTILCPWGKGMGSLLRKAFYVYVVCGILCLSLLFYIQQPRWQRPSGWLWSDINLMRILWKPSSIFWCLCKRSYSCTANTLELFLMGDKPLISECSHWPIISRACTILPHNKVINTAKVLPGSVNFWNSSRLMRSAGTMPSAISVTYMNQKSSHHQH